jgi:hypothetical protein
VSACNSGYQISANSCVAIVPPTPVTCVGATSQACTIANGSGSQSRTCTNGVFSAFSACAVTSCNSGYVVSGNTCVQDSTPPVAGNCTTIKRFNITWNFKERPCGQYANGDWWVVGPVTITSISPASTKLASGRVINGSMINPNSAQFPQHGFDSHFAGFTSGGFGYQDSLNVARPGQKDLSSTNLLNVPNNSSLVSSISHADATHRPTITDISILTVVPSAPAAGSFRPPYAGTDKAHYWNKNNLNYDILSRLPLAGTSSPNAIAERLISRPWFELGTEGDSRNFHPENHQNEYGAYMAGEMNDLLLSLHLDYSNAEKELLYVRIVQWGLDLYGCAKTGGLWAGNGGVNAGRKAPVVMAALALNDANIKKYADSKSTVGWIFHDDRQIFRVSDGDIGRQMYNGDGRQRDTYNISHKGLAEWGEKHDGSPDRDGSNWGTYYRDINYRVINGASLAIMLTTGGKAAWNNDLYFEYADRAWSISSGDMHALPGAMWKAHRSKAKP